MTPQEIYDDLKSKFGDAIVEAKLDAAQPWIRIAENRTAEICTYLRSENRMQFDYLSCLFVLETNAGTMPA